MPDNYKYMHVTLHCLCTLCHVLIYLFGGTVIYLLIHNSKTNFKKGYRDIVPTVRFKPCLKMDMPSHTFNLNVQKMCSKLERSQIASFHVAPALWHHDFSSPRPQFTWIILNLCQPDSRFNKEEHTTIEHLPLHFVLQIRWSSSNSSFTCEIVQIVSICFRRTFLIRACPKNNFRLTPIFVLVNTNNSLFDVSFVCLYIHDHAKQRKFGICSRGLKSETLPLTSVPAGFCFSWKALEALHVQPVWRAL